MVEETKEAQPKTEQQQKNEEQLNKINQDKTGPSQDKDPEKTFNQEALDKIVHYRLQEEKRKYDRILEQQKSKEQDSLKEKELKEAKGKAELEKIMQTRLAEKDTVINKYKDQIKTDKVDNSILNLASTNKAINPQQVVSLLKAEVKLTDDNRIEVLDANSNIRYNEKGELLTIEQRVKEFLDANPHFRQGSLSGTGSQSSIGGNTVKPFKIQDLNMSNNDDRKKYAEYRKERDSKPTQINLNNKQ